MLKCDFVLQQGIVPIQMKSSDAVSSAEEENLALHPRKAMMHHKKKRKLEAKLRKKRHLEKLKLVMILIFLRTIQCIVVTKSI